jgi:integrase
MPSELKTPPHRRLIATGTPRGRTNHGLALSTRKAYALMMRLYVIPYFAGRRLSDLGRADVKAFINHLATVPARHPQKGTTHLSPATIRTILTPLRAMLAEAYERELLSTDAGRVRVIVGRPATPATAPKTLSREQFATLLEHVRPEDQLLVFLLRWTGLRLQELLWCSAGGVQVRTAGYYRRFWGIQALGNPSA